MIMATQSMIEEINTKSGILKHLSCRNRVSPNPIKCKVLMIVFLVLPKPSSALVPLMALGNSGIPHSGYDDLTTEIATFLWLEPE